MRNEKKLLFYFQLIFFVFTSPISLAQSDQFRLYLPEFRGGLQPGIVWPQSFSVYQEISKECQGNITCRLRSLRQLGANNQALAFNRATSGNIQSYKQFNGVYYFTAWQPDRQPQQAIYIGGNNGVFFTVDDWFANQRPLNNLLDYESQKINGIYRDTQIVNQPQIPPSYSLASDGDQSLTFHYPLVNPCKDIIGNVMVEFSFDKNGNTLGANFSNIKLRDPGNVYLLTGNCAERELSDSQAVDSEKNNQ